MEKYESSVKFNKHTYTPTRTRDICCILFSDKE